MERSEFLWRLGNVYAVVAVHGRLGILIWVVALEWMRVPFGSATVIGSWVVGVLEIGAWSDVKKWPVLPCQQQL
jgi:hypothetical protein